MSPDWSAHPVPVPYADLTDPQTLDLYGYVRNNPLSHADPDGHCIPWCTAALGAIIGGTADVITQEIRNPGASINWREAGAAATGGLVAGATLGLAAPAELTTLGGTVVVSSAGTGETVAVGAASGVAGGIAERTVESNGNLKQATDSPSAIAVDAATGAAGELVNRGVEAGVKSAAGSQLKKAEAAMARVGPKTSASVRNARTAAVAAAEGRLNRVQNAATVTAAVAVETTADHNKPKDKDKP